MPTKTAGVEPAARASAWRPGSAKIDVGILGATGAVGQQFIALLGESSVVPRHVAGGERTFGRKALWRLTWRLPTELPEDTARLSVEALKAGAGPQLVFSALDSAIAGEAEVEFASAGHVVVSNSRNHRMDALVPLLIPEVNPEHLGLLPLQRKVKGWSGAIVTNPNCAAMPLGDCAGGFAHVSTEARADHHHAGIVRSGISGRGVLGCHGERDSVY